MSRSIWKGPFINKSLLKFDPLINKNKKIWERQSVIGSNLIGSNVFIYNGKDFKKLQITREKVGYKFGEFSFTRKKSQKKEKVQSKKKPTAKK